ncbi:hypothetical protein B0H13DRAFT_1913476 [Mycena leptocephala]|nr:hypothetical protein B0H13DRAFT_1913476 [Mycena leptocephala]
MLAVTTEVWSCARVLLGYISRTRTAVTVSAHWGGNWGGAEGLLFPIFQTLLPAVTKNTRLSPEKCARPQTSNGKITEKFPPLRVRDELTRKRDSSRRSIPPVTLFITRGKKTPPVGFELKTPAFRDSSAEEPLTTKPNSHNRTESAIKYVKKPLLGFLSNSSRAANRANFFKDKSSYQKERDEHGQAGSREVYRLHQKVLSSWGIQPETTRRMRLGDGSARGETPARSPTSSREGIQLSQRRNRQPAEAVLQVTGPVGGSHRADTRSLELGKRMAVPVRKGLWGVIEVLVSKKKSDGMEKTADGMRKERDEYVLNTEVFGVQPLQGGHVDVSIVLELPSCVADMDDECPSAMEVGPEDPVVDVVSDSDEPLNDALCPSELILVLPEGTGDAEAVVGNNVPVFGAGPLIREAGVGVVIPVLPEGTGDTEAVVDNKVPVSEVSPLIREAEVGVVDTDPGVSKSEVLLNDVLCPSTLLPLMTEEAGNGDAVVGDKDTVLETEPESKALLPDPVSPIELLPLIREEAEGAPATLVITDWEGLLGDPIGGPLELLPLIMMLPVIIEETEGSLADMFGRGENSGLLVDPVNDCDTG